MKSSHDAELAIAARMREMQVEDDVHRVLQLVRGQRALARAKDRGKVDRKRAAGTARRQHDHARAMATPSAKLPQAKIQALMAVYGLRTSAPPLAKPQRPDGDADDADGSEKMADDRRLELLETRRRIYRNHFSGLQATYGPTGRPKLESLINAAVDAKRKSSCHSSLAIGAAVFTSANRIYTSGRLESAQDSRFDVCAERAALLKVLEHQSQSGRVEVVEAVVISSDQRGLLPMPCGSCREFLAEFGDFPVFLLNAENDSKEIRSFELFPHARHSTFTRTLAVPIAPRQSKVTKTLESGEDKQQFSANARDWTCEQVAQWLVDSVELPQYADVFRDKRVDGATLWHLADSDLQLLLGIVHPLHRRRLLVHIDRIKDWELLDHGLDFGQIQDYLAVLDRDRLDVVAQLKVTFDRLDHNKDGLLDFAELTEALRGLGLHCGDDGASPVQASGRLLQSLADCDSGAVSFPVFVRAFADVAHLPAAELRDAGNSRVPSVDLLALRQTFDKADANGSGAVDEQELVKLLQSLGRDKCEARAKEWFEKADLDGDARLSFAEFFLRYAQLTGVDLTTIRAIFDGGRPGESKSRRRPLRALQKALHELFPHVDTSDLKVWCERRLWRAEGEKAKEGGDAPLTLSFADFALACVMYGEALRLRVAQLSQLTQSLGNDARCHRSRVVHLQQSGHVRLCRHPGGGEGEVDVGERRRRHLQGERSKRRTGSDREETKHEEEEEEDVIEATFRRFTAQQREGRKKREKEEEGKQQEDDSEKESDDRLLNAVEAAQALIELGVVCSREQLLRFLDREGFGVRRAISQRAFYSLVKRLRVFQAISQRSGCNREEALGMWEDALGDRCDNNSSSKRGGDETRLPQRRHANRQDYDAYLRDKHIRRKTTNGGRVPERERRRCVEMERARGRRRRSSSVSSSSSDSSDEGTRRRRCQRRRRRSSSSSSSTSTASSTESHSPHSRRPLALPRRRGRPPSDAPFFRGFEIGDRVVASRGRGAGTLVRLYRDFFVADVHFDNGDKAKNVELSHLKRLSERDSDALQAADRVKRDALVVGAGVRVAHKGTKTATRRAVVMRCRTDGTYDVVASEHGEQELLQRVPLSQLAVVGKPVVYSSGQRVTVKKRREYVRGCVAVCRTDGTYDVKARGGGVMKSVAWELLAPDEEEEDDEEEEAEEEEEEKRSPKHKNRRREEEDDGKEDEEEDAFRVGDQVEARFQGKSVYYGGLITRVHGDGSCDVQYDDGDVETRVRRALIRAVATRKAKPQASSYDDDEFESD